MLSSNVKSVAKAKQLANPYLSEGQCLMYSLHSIDPDLYASFVETEADCYNNNDNIRNFFLRLYEAEKSRNN